MTKFELKYKGNRIWSLVCGKNELGEYKYCSPNQAVEWAKAFCSSFSSYNLEYKPALEKYEKIKNEKEVLKKRLSITKKLQKDFENNSIVKESNDKLKNSKDKIVNFKKLAAIQSEVMANNLKEEKTELEHTLANIECPLVRMTSLKNDQ